MFTWGEGQWRLRRHFFDCRGNCSIAATTWSIKTIMCNSNVQRSHVAITIIRHLSHAVLTAAWKRSTVLKEHHSLITEELSFVDRWPRSVRALIGWQKPCSVAGWLRSGGRVYEISFFASSTQAQLYTEQTRSATHSPVTSYWQR